MSRSPSLQLSAADKPLVWIDCEMTGLDTQNDTILEIAAIITNGDLEPVGAGFETIIHKPKEILDNMNEWCIEQHGKSGLTSSCLNSKVSLSEAEKSLHDYVVSIIPEPKIGVLAGNTVYMDKMFLMRETPSVMDHLHYRIVDVSSLKELVRRWCGQEVVDNAPKKKINHRAMDDIKESIEELKYYKSVLFTR